jgi:DNA mismatch repair protein MutL
LYDKGKKKFTYETTNDLKQRIKNIFGETFSENLFEVKIERGKYSLYGFIGVPTFNKPSSNYQYFFVNNRFVKDKIFALALRSAYSGLIPSGRYPVAILFLDMPHDEVDVNAHPAKTEIRFKEVEMVRGFLISSLKKLITAFGASRPSTEVVNDVFQTKDSEKSIGSQINQSFKVDNSNLSTLRDVHQTPIWTSSRETIPQSFQNYENKQKLYNSGIFAPQKSSSSLKLDSDNISPKSSFKNQKFEENYVESNAKSEQNILPRISEQFSKNSDGKINLGTALYQIANTYIVAATEDALILVDQHAVAERITLEKLKKSTKLDSQDLLLPEMCPLSEAKVELFEKNSELISKFGIVYEKMSPDMIIVKALPSILGSCEAKPLINDIADELENMGDIYSLDERIHLILSTISCHGSLRAGRKLSIEEMNALLRQMESTENIAQCCHGRPSYVMLTTKNLNKFFERS